MKLTTEFNENLVPRIVDEDEILLQKAVRNHKTAYTIPSHKAKMKVKRKSGVELMTVIMPPVSVHYNMNKVKDNIIPKSDIRYTIGGTKLAYPIAHIYASSGYVCLGSIFVPNDVSIYTPLLPLETLMLHNDRNTNHGNAHINVTDYQITLIQNILDKIETKNATKKYFNMNHNWVKNDTLWNISIWVLENTDDMRAIEIMDEIYDILFDKHKHETDQKQALN